MPIQLLFGPTKAKSWPSCATNWALAVFFLKQLITFLCLRVFCWMASFSSFSCLLFLSSTLSFSFSSSFRFLASSWFYAWTSSVFSSRCLAFASRVWFLTTGSIFLPLSPGVDDTWAPVPLISRLWFWSLLCVNHAVIFILRRWNHNIYGVYDLPIH